MRKNINKHRRDVEFKVGDYVFLKFQPYRFRSLASHLNEKLSPRFYGPYEITERVGKVAYKLQFPQTAQIHLIFHVSQLKRQNWAQSYLPAVTK